MTVHCLQSFPGPTLQAALSQFEEQFDYPLGDSDRFRIDHSDDYSRFFRAMGEAAIFVHEDKMGVQGVLSCAERTMLGPDESPFRALYLCDLKVQNSPRKGRILLRLLRAVRDHFQERLRFGYAVVMDGTAVLPSQYTGRLGLPLFQKIGEMAIYNFVTPQLSPSPDTCPENFAQLSDIQLAYLNPEKTAYRASSSDASLRSSTAPLALMLPDKSAYGVVEDTERAKQLISLSSGSLCSAHLSQFVYHSLPAGAALIRAALRHCQKIERPRLFVALSKSDGPALLNQLSDLSVTKASATIFGHGFLDGKEWLINSSEI